MKKIRPQYIKLALETEFDNVKPGNDIRNRVFSTLPLTEKPFRQRPLLPRVALLVAVLVLSFTGFAVAGTAQGKAAANWVGEKFGIVLTTKTPEVMADIKQRGGETSVVAGIPLEQGTDYIPTYMKIPRYLPEEVNGGRASVYPVKTGTAGIRWSKDKQFVEVWWHARSFGPGSVALTNGDAMDIQEVKLNDLTALAFRDDSGWNLSWAMDRHQYIVRTNISLEEGVKVAKSLK
ncbi:MAG TPA: DUF4367 domain-containing protein [Verrucomicrobiae bacterium]|nr:DUF4367 domain-containing protein [Verrucomicrobiae bacterium]